MKVLLSSPRYSRMHSMLKDMLPDDVHVIISEKGTEEELIQLAIDVDVIVCTKLSEEVAKAARKLKLVQKSGAGVDALPFDVLRDNVFVANTSGANPVPLAEGAVALVLALAKHVVRRHNLYPQGDNTSRRGIELRGKNAGVIGLGHIGMKVARFLKAFNMKILAIKRHPKNYLKTQLNIDFLGGPSELDHLLQKSDFVIITSPLTAETRGIIGERELHLMKSTAYIVNVSRADIIQEEALYRALKEGWIAGAGLDVWWPPHWWDPAWNPNGQTPHHPIWKLPNVIATPHNIGSTDVPSDAGIHIIAENIRRIMEGKPPVNKVDKNLRY